MHSGPSALGWQSCFACQTQCRAAGSLVCVADVVFLTELWKFRAQVCLFSTVSPGPSTEHVTQLVLWNYLLTER